MTADWLSIVPQCISIGAITAIALTTADPEARLIALGGLAGLTNPLASLGAGASRFRGSGRSATASGAEPTAMRPEWSDR